METAKTKPTSIDDYLAACPRQAIAALQEIRKIIKTITPEAAETISYAIPAYKLPGQNRAFVYISGYAKHVSIYPLPDLQEAQFGVELDSYIAGKGTLRFNLNEPLPLDLITKVVEALHTRALS